MVLIAAFIVGILAVMRYVQLRERGGSYSSGLWTLGAALLILSALSFAGMFILPVAALILLAAARPSLPGQRTAQAC